MIKNNSKRILYTFCFFLFCLIDQRSKTGSGLDGVIESFQYSMGIVIAIIIFSHYKWNDFKRFKVPYIIWTVLGSIGCVAAFLWGRENRPFMNAWTILLIAVLIWGYIVIHTIIEIVIEKHVPAVNTRMLMVWFVMIVLMVVSRSHYIWPFCYGVMFLCLYLTEFSDKERKDMQQGCLDGIILSFIVFQGFCCVFRPYDMVRYTGIHNNCNLNALYYLAVLGAVFSKILYYTKQNVSKWIRLCYWLLAGAVYSYLFMTIGRIAWITAFVAGLIFLVFLNRLINKKKLLINGMILVLCALIMFPVCFGATRYLPPVFHHPIWFWGEWSDEKVHSWDAWNSEKYIDMDELLEAAVGRITDSIQNVLEHSPFLLKAEAAEDPRVKAAVLDDKYAKDSLLIRKTIYQQYIKNLNLWGHPYEEQGFQLFSWFWIGHAHNIYLQYGTDFGIPVMVLFTVLILWGMAAGFKRGCRNHNIADMATVFYILIPALFGMFECAWGVGSLSITMLFMAWGTVIRK